MEKQSGIDLATAAAAVNREDEGQLLHVRNADGTLAYIADEQAPDGQRPVTVRVAGSYSKTYRQAIERQRDAVFRTREPITAEIRAQRKLELVAACILAWDGFSNAGEPFPCTPANAQVLLTTAPWIRDAVEEAMFDHQGFIKSSSAA